VPAIKIYSSASVLLEVRKRLRITSRLRKVNFSRECNELAEKLIWVEKSARLRNSLIAVQLSRKLAGIDF